MFPSETCCHHMENIPIFITWSNDCWTWSLWLRFWPEAQNQQDMSLSSVTASCLFMCEGLMNKTGGDWTWLAMTLTFDLSAIILIYSSEIMSWYEMCFENLSESCIFIIGKGWPHIISHYYRLKCDINMNATGNLLITTTWSLLQTSGMLINSAAIFLHLKPI